VYCYLQMNLHMYRVLLLLPCMVFHFLFVFSLNHHHYNYSYYDNDDPLHHFIKNYSLQAEQITKVEQTTKNTIPVLPALGPALIEAFSFMAELDYPGSRHDYLMPSATMPCPPPALFHNRASPVIKVPD